MRELLVATRSAHKLKEIRELLGGGGQMVLLDLDAAGILPAAAEDEIEAFDSFEENALAKARYFADRVDLPVLADDSGLCVDALHGAPGVRSKRFSGAEGAGADEANNLHLLSLMKDVPDHRRSAHYSCVIALVDPAGEEKLFHGRCEGEILRAPRGTEGFGYDPLFYLPAEKRTFAEMPPEGKNRMSHRARALQAAAGYLLHPRGTGRSARE